MGHQAQMKAYRKQVRNVALQNYPEFLREESVKAFEKQALEVIGTRLDQIAANVDKQMATMDTQNRQFRSLLMQDAGMQISRELASISVTMLAWTELFGEKLGFTSDDISGQVEERKKVIYTRLEAEAKAKEEADAATKKAAESVDVPLIDAAIEAIASDVNDE